MGFQSMDNDWTYRYFVEKAELFRVVMDSKDMISRGRSLALAIARYLREYGLERARILDVGCGTGRVAIPLAKLGYEVVGIDISPRFIEIASQRAEEHGVKDKVKFIVCDARVMSHCLAAFQPFDVILFVWSTVLGYYDVETDIQVLRAASAISSPNALLIIAETASKDFISFLSNFVGGFRWYIEYDEHVVIESPIYNPTTGELLTKLLFYKKERNRDLKFLDEAHFKIKLYTLDELINIAKQAGWCFQEALRSFLNREPYRTLGALNVVLRKCSES